MSSQVSHPISRRPEHFENLDLIDLNPVMQQALRRMQRSGRHLEVIVRCEHLPVMNTVRADMEAVFSSLVSIIGEKAATDCRRFLYIGCSEEHKDISADLTNGYKRFLLQFHSNVSTDARWKEVHSDVLESCSQLLKKFQADLTVYEVKNTGCLFSISLLGKL
jgi:hypothetical protein